MKSIKHGFVQFWKDEKGLGTLEILLIVAVLVAIAIIFRKWIGSWFQKLIGDANTNLKSDTSIPTCEPGPDKDC